MANFTPNFNLRKPVPTENFDIDRDFNANWDTIDGELKEREAEITALDSEVILARGTEPTLGERLDGTDQRIDDIITTPVPTGEIIAQEIIDARQGEGSVGANITGVKSQLAQKANQSELEQTNSDLSGVNQRVDNLVIPISVENANIEVTDAHVSVEKSKTFSTIGQRFEEIEEEYNDTKDIRLLQYVAAYDTDIKTYALSESRNNSSGMSITVKGAIFFITSISKGQTILFSETTSQIAFNVGEFIGGIYTVTVPNNNLLVMDFAEVTPTIKIVDQRAQTKDMLLLARAHQGEMNGGALYTVRQSIVDKFKPLGYAHLSTNVNTIISSKTNGTDVSLTVSGAWFIHGNDGVMYYDYGNGESNVVYDVGTYQDGLFNITLSHNDILVLDTGRKSIRVVTFLNVKQNHIILYKNSNGKVFTGAFLDMQQTNKVNAHENKINVLEASQSSSVSSRNNGVEAIAHRGLSRMAPENTLVAYQLASDYGFKYVETDIIETSDGHFVIMHDSTLDRTTNGTGSINNMTLAEVQAFNVDTGSNIDFYGTLPIPTLEEFLLVCKENNLTPIIECKTACFINEDSIDNFVSIIENFGMLNHVIALGQLAKMQSLRNVTPNMKIQVIADLTTENIGLVKGLGNADIAYDYASLTKAKIDEAHRNELKVNAFTINNKPSVVAEMGADFISTDVLINYNTIESTYSLNQYKLSDMDNIANWTVNGDSVIISASTNANVKKKITTNYGDVIEVSAYVKHNSGVLPRISLDNYLNGTRVGNVTHSAITDVEGWQKVSFKLLCKDSLEVADEYEVIIGTWAGETSNFELKGLKVNVFSK